MRGKGENNKFLLIPFINYIAHPSSNFFVILERNPVAPRSEMSFPHDNHDPLATTVVQVVEPDKVIVPGDVLRPHRAGVAASMSLAFGFYQ